MKYAGMCVLAAVGISALSGCSTMPDQIPTRSQTIEKAAEDSYKRHYQETLRAEKALEPDAKKVAAVAVHYAKDGMLSLGEQTDIMVRAKPIYGEIRRGSEWLTVPEAPTYANLLELCLAIVYKDASGIKASIQKIGDVPSDLEVEIQKSE